MPQGILAPSLTFDIVNPDKMDKIWLISLVGTAWVVSALGQIAPSVSISSPDATITGLPGEVESFNGIPFAQPPTGLRRLKPQQRLNSSLGSVSATGIAPACPQFILSVNKNQFPFNIVGELLDLPMLQTVFNEKEDCLTVTVQCPAGTKAGSKLPVLFWICPGAFQMGGTQVYGGASLVREAMGNEQPIIFVTANYRVGAFGFLPGAEVLAD